MTSFFKQEDHVGFRLSQEAVLGKVNKSERSGGFKASFEVAS